MLLFVLFFLPLVKRLVGEVRRSRPEFENDPAVLRLKPKITHGRSMGVRGRRHLS
jgi:hypothetical protein